MSFVHNNNIPTQRLPGGGIADLVNQMDPNNPLRGPRRAARRGEEALRYDGPDVDVDVDDSDVLPTTETEPEFVNEGSWGPAYDDAVVNDPMDAFDRPRSEWTPQMLLWEEFVGAEIAEEQAREARRRARADPEYQGDPDDLSEDMQDDSSEVLGDDRYAPEAVELEALQYSVQHGQGDEDDDDDAEELGDEEADDEMRGPSDGDDEEEGEDGAMLFDPVQLGLKEINNLAHFSVSSHKPGSGVEALLHDDLGRYWQSDGPQPHLLTVHFLRRVEIRAIRFYVDYNQDESYTPTCVVLSAGTGHHDLLEFASVVMTTPVGWQAVDLSGAGGGADGQALCCWMVQIQVRENHQNGKDTHIRGIKLYALDENVPPADAALDDLAELASGADEDYLLERVIAQSSAHERPGSMAAFLREPEIR